ncbi:MAG: hypothetical protein INR73_05280 [Williamsia sp.]|nr:hypothetical protein [Williamsia sp.]
MKKLHTYKAIYVLPAVLLQLYTLSCFSQYYYKDILNTRDVNHNFLLYKTNKVSRIKLNSFQGNTPVTEGFVCEQKITGNQMVTYTKTADAGESYFTAYYNGKSLLTRSVDSSEETISTTLYEYDDADHILKMANETRARDGSSKTAEVHTWQYNQAGKPVKMLRIRDGRDTTTILFTLDEKGNVSEEGGVAGKGPEKIYYYYDDQNRLTDIVRYNNKAKRLLPDYMFEWDENGELATMLVVPEGSSDYLKWYYKYDEAGLKAVDFCYNKQKELQGKIEYSYNSSGK